MKPAISVIVPIYNSERYLENCICSILQQFFSDFELILVNDGSVDNSKLICNKYANLDSRVKVINQENRGVSAARNAGIKIALGEYITFVDSDDWLEKCMLGELYSKAVSEGSDLTVCCLKRVTDKGQIISDFCFGISKTIKYESMLPDEFYLLLKTYAVFQPVCKLFKLEYLREYNLSFENDLSFGEDFTFNIKYFEKIKSITLIDSSLYFYRNNTQSLSSKFNEKKSYSYVVTKNLLYKFVNENQIFEGQTRKFVLNNIFLDYRDCVFQIINSKLILKDKMKHFYTLNRCSALKECIELLNTNVLKAIDNFCIKYNKFWFWYLYSKMALIFNLCSAVKIRLHSAL